MKKYATAIAMACVLALGSCWYVPVMAAETAEETEDTDKNLSEDNSDSEIDLSAVDPADETPIQTAEEESVPEQEESEEKSEDEQETSEEQESEETGSATADEVTVGELELVEEKDYEPDYLNNVASEPESLLDGQAGAWKFSNGVWYYTDQNGENLKGIAAIDGTTYLLDLKTGAMKISQWYQIGNNWYRSDGYGRLLTGWQMFDGQWYYLDPDNDGAMARNRFITDENGQHYVDGYGILQTNKVIRLNGDLYALNVYGILQVDGWCQVGGKWYCAGTDGVLKTGFLEIDGTKYLLDSRTGAMKVNEFIEIGNDWYYFDSYGRQSSGWVNYGGGWYYMDPDDDGALARNRFIEDENGLYYVNGYGVLQVNKITIIDGEPYAFNAYGIMQNSGWCQVGGKWCYADPNGVLRTGIQEIGGIKYYLDSKTGALKTNAWYLEEDTWYFFDGYGRLHTGWAKYGNEWYYLDPEQGGAMATGLITVGGTMYYLNEDGAMQTYVIVMVNGVKYYVDGFGRAARRASKPDGKYYRADIVSLAQSLVGVREGTSTHHMIVDTYNDTEPLPRGYTVRYSDAWCAVFTSYLAIECDYTDIIPVECGCPQWISQARAMGSWVESDGYTPLPGDFILYDWGDSGSGDNTGTPDHIGVIERVSGGRISVIEGNYQDMVKRRDIAVNGTYIRGFVVPDYSD